MQTACEHKNTIVLARRDGVDYVECVDCRQIFEAEDAGQLVERLKKAIATRQIRSETRLWRSAWTLLLFLALLTGEWVARKFAGLP